MAGNLDLAEFEGWLSKALTDLDIDAEVYGTYITGILDEEDDSESKKEALEGILGSLVEDPEDLCQQVLAKWRPHQFKNGNDQEKKASTIEDIFAAHSAKVATEKPNVVEKPSSEVADSAMKRALLAKYSEVYEDEDEEVSNKTTQFKAVAPVTSGLFQNINAKAVTDAEKQKRDKEKENYQNKKDKDKVDREKQKQKKEERKDKEKKRTQKKERSAR